MLSPRDFSNRMRQWSTKSIRKVGRHQCYFSSVYEASSSRLHKLSGLPPAVLNLPRDILCAEGMSRRPYIGVLSLSADAVMIMGALSAMTSVAVNIPQPQPYSTTHDASTTLQYAV